MDLGNKDREECRASCSDGHAQAQGHAVSTAGKTDVGRLLDGVRKIGHLMVRESDPRRLIERVCIALTESIGYCNAWIGLIDAQKQCAELTASSGFNGSFSALRDRLAAGDFPRCVGAAIEGHQSFLVKDPPSECTGCPNADSYRGRAGFSKALVHEDRLFGVLCVSVHRDLVHDPEARMIFGELSDDIALALYKMEAARQLARANEIIVRSPAVVLVWKNEAGWPVSFATDNAFRLFGRTPEELCAPAFQYTSVVYADDLPRVMKEVTLRSRDAASDAILHQPYRIVRPDGEVRWIRDMTRILRGEDGAVRGYEGTLLDVSDQRHVEEELRTKSAAIDAALNAVAVADLEGALTFVNPAFLKLWGYATVLEVKGRSVLSFWQDPSAAAQVTAALHTAGKWVGELRAKHKDGSQFDVNLAAALVRDREGRPSGMVASFEDVTGRKQAVQALQESERRYRAIVEDQTEWICRFGADGSLTWMNQSAAKLLDARPSSSQEQDAVVFSETDGLRVTPEAAARLTPQSPLADSEQEATLASGQSLWIAWRLHGLFGEDGGLREIQAVGHDITVRKRLHEQTVTTRKMEAVAQLAGGVAHDFNNKLGVILGRAEIALDELPPDHPVREDLHHIQAAAESTAHLTSKLLGFSRRQMVMPKVLDLNHLIDSALGRFRKLVDESINLEWRPAHKLDSIRMDPAQMDQILSHLVANAKDAIQGEGTIALETAQGYFEDDYSAGRPGFAAGEYVVLKVSDTGCGMDPQTLEHVFEPFFTTRDIGQGKGLGLATVYGIVKQNKGFIYISSEVGRGTEAAVYLPPHKVQQGDALPQGAQTAIPCGEYKILLVEDEPGILEMGKTMLKRQGYEVFAAAGPNEALRLAGEIQGNVDVLVTDVMMPEMNGSSLAKLLLKRFPRMKCLFMSGYTADIMFGDGVLDERENFLQKPFTHAALCQKVNALLGA